MSVYERVHAVLSELPAIGKNRTAPGNMGGYAFRGIEDITAELKPLLAKHGVFMVPTVVQRLESGRVIGSGKTMWVVDLLVRFTFYGVEPWTSSTSVPAPVVIETSADLTPAQVREMKAQWERAHAPVDSFSAEVWGEGTDMGDKATQKAMTSAFKSMLAVTFCISDSDSDAEAHDVPESVEGDQRRAAAQPNVSASAPAATGPTNGPPAPSANRVRKLKERAAALVAANVPVADTRIARKLPIVDKCDEDQIGEWEQMLDELDAELSAPFPEEEVAPFVSTGVLEQMAEGLESAGADA